MGSAWISGDLNRAAEHLATWTTLQQMACLCRLPRHRPAIGVSVVVAAAEGELHWVGASMIADHFFMGRFGRRFPGTEHTYGRSCGACGRKVARTGQLIGVPARSSVSGEQGNHVAGGDRSRTVRVCRRLRALDLRSHLGNPSRSCFFRRSRGDSRRRGVAVSTSGSPDPRKAPTRIGARRPEATQEPRWSQQELAGRAVA